MQTLRFVIVGMQRSGTTLLADSLDQHPEILCCRELFDEDEKIRREDRFFWTPEIPASRFLEQTLYGPSRAQATGFKLLHHQALTTDVWSYLANDRRIAVIHVVRANALESLASAATAWQTRVWNTRDATGVPEPDITLDPEQCRRWFRESDEFQEQVELRFGAHPFYRVEYADLHRDYAATVRELYGWLGVADFRPAARLKKIARRPLRERIRNWDALRREFAGSRCESFF